MTSASERWNIDTARSSVGFTVRHLVVSKVHGKFARWSGTFTFDESSPSASSAEAEIEVASVETGDAERDNFLRTDEFLDIARFPRMTFKSSSVAGSGKRLKVTGDLTLRGVTRPVVLDVERTGQRFMARTTLSRKDFGVNFSALLEAGGVAVADKVEVQIEVEARRI